MSEMPAWLVTIGGGMAALATGAFGWFAGSKRRNASEAAEVAQQGVIRTEAEAERDVIELLRAELHSAREDFKKLRSEFDAERRRRWQLEDHIAQLERLMRAQGMDVPQLVPQEAAT